MYNLPEGRPKLRFPPQLLQLAARLDERAGTSLYAVGGTVRDALLGVPVDDWDLATAASPELVAASFAQVAADAPVVEEDHSLGTVGRRIEGIDAVVSTFRVESDYGPDRRPRSLRFVGTPEQDAARRDFTCNAIYLPVLPAGGGLIDPVGGIEDLRRRELRVVGEPCSRLREDPVRILRAARFVARFGFTRSDATEVALRAAGPSVAGLSSYRLRTELELLFAGASPQRGLDVLAAAEVLSAALPEAVQGVSGRASTGLRPGVELVGGLLPEVAWALWIHGGPPVAAVSDVPEDRPAPARLDGLLDRLDCGRVVRERARGVLAVLDALARAGDPADVDVPGQVFAHWPALSGIVEPLTAGLGSRWAARWQRWAEHCAAAVARDRAIDALLGGADLLALGVPPGPDLGRLLRRVRDRLRDEGITSRDTALRIAGSEVGRDLQE